MSSSREHESCRSRRRHSADRFIGEAYDLPDEDTVIIATSNINDITASIEYGRTATLDELTEKVDVYVFVPLSGQGGTRRSARYEREIKIRDCSDVAQTIVVRETQVYIESGALTSSRDGVVQKLSARVCDHERDDLIVFAQQIIEWMN